MSQFQILTQKQIADARASGKILRECLEKVASEVREGITTGELDRIAEEFIRSHAGATPVFKGYHGYPATLCTSVDDECVHGIPGSRRLANGDIVSLDCGVRYRGLVTDACVTVAVGTIPPEVRRFLERSKQALDDACAMVRSALRVGDISAAIQRTVESGGYKCVRSLTGHGVGSELHQYPDIPNTGTERSGPMIPAFTLLAIEPITSMGTDEIREGGDGWTIKTADGSRSAHFEHTVLVLPEGHEILA
jgi:methionyl aminopeptidase